MSRSKVAIFTMATVSACLLGAPIALAGSTPPVGVYGCYDARMAFSPIHGSQLEITPTPFAMFGLIDPATYADWDGHHGTYSYDVGSGVLTMTDGSRQGWRYRKVGNWSFTLIDNKSGKEIYTCPFNAAKDPSHGPW